MTLLLSPAPTRLLIPLSFLVILAASRPGLAADSAGYRSFVASDALQGDLKGAVRLVKTQTFDVEDDGRQTKVEETSTSYDPAGYLLEDVSVDLEENEQKLFRRTYDESGNLVAEEETAGPQTVKKKVRLAPERRTVFWETETSPGRLRLLSEMTFDRFGKEGAGRDYDDRGKVDQQYKTRRDQNGKEVEVVFSDGNGRPEDIEKVVWDARGFPVSSEHESRTEKFVAKTKSEYSDIDLEGNWLRQTSVTEFFEGSRKVLTSREVVTRTIEYH